MSTVFAAVAAGLFGTGTYLVLQEELTRKILGLSLLSHGANVVLLASTRQPGRPAFVDGRDDPSTFLDPLPQAFVLTAIVITFGVTCFLLALAYRSWVLTRDDTVHLDPEDVRVREEPTGDMESFDPDQVAADMERSGLDEPTLGSSR